MDLADIYKKFDRIGCLTFATIDQGYPQTRIAHLFAYDHEGLYFRTMITKAFYNQLKKSEKVSICGMFPNIIDHTKCDVCGDCYTICPANAVEIVIDNPND